MLNRFFAVTATSLYLVQGHQPNRSTAQKVVMREPSRTPQGSMLGSNHYAMIGIGFSLVAYTPEQYPSAHSMTREQRDYMQVAEEFKGPHSSPIVALFVWEVDAIKCLACESRKSPDSRWLDSTRHVIAEIEKNDAFYVHHSRQWGLLERVPLNTLAV